MSEKTSRYILIIEAALIAFPLSSLAVWGSISFIVEARNFRYVINTIMGILAIFGLLAIGSGWHLFIVYLRKGTKELKNQPASWWLVILIGVMILVASLISNLIPPSPEYTRWWNFRANFDVVAFGLPMLIPLCHLAYERLFRKASS
jgi:uncharacterized membrane protein HdeD (DUF308 family)